MEKSDLFALNEREGAPREGTERERRHPATLAEPTGADSRRHASHNDRILARQASADPNPELLSMFAPADRVNALERGAPDLIDDPCLPPSQLPFLEVLRRPPEPKQYVSIRYTERLGEAGIEPSAGSIGDSYDNALTETINGLFKAEVIWRNRPWRSYEEVEFATLEWVDWFNHRRHLEPIGNLPPAEFEAMHYAMQESPPTMGGPN